MPTRTSKRKYSHIDICLRKKVEARAKRAGFEDIELLHRGLPELDFERIDASCKFLGKKVSAPLVIESITGGYSGAARINSALAKAAEKEGIVLELGSQRAMLENPKLAGTYAIRDKAPSIPILGNIGLPQLKEYSVKQLEGGISAIDADGLVVHLNSLQEACQREGDRMFAGLLANLEKLCSGVSCPVIAKETGAGVSMETAVLLEKAGVSMIDVAGAGGTSWSAVELYRGSGETEFWDWGIPTVQSVAECAKAVKIPIISSGGVRSGIDVAKSIAIGASYAGAALPFLKKVNTGGSGALQKEISEWKRELKTTMFLSGAKDLKALSKIPTVITGRTGEALSLRGIDIKKMALR